MHFEWILPLFLYFPEDKSEYIPAFINLMLFTLAALLMMRLIVKISAREAKKAQQLEQQLKSTQNKKEI